MNDTTVKLLLKLLTRHFKEPVMPLSAFTAGTKPEEEEPSPEVSVVEVRTTNAVVDPKDMRLWLEKLGWIPKPSTMKGVMLWEKLVRDHGVTEKVVLGFPTEDNDPNWPRYVEEAAYILWEKFGTTPRSFLIEVFNGGQGSHVTWNT